MRNKIPSTSISVAYSTLSSGLYGAWDTHCRKNTKPLSRMPLYIFICFSFHCDERNSLSHKWENALIEATEGKNRKTFKFDWFGTEAKRGLTRENQIHLFTLNVHFGVSFFSSFLVLWFYCRNDRDECGLMLLMLFSYLTTRSIQSPN